MKFDSVDGGVNGGYIGVGLWGYLRHLQHWTHSPLEYFNRTAFCIRRCDMVGALDSVETSCKYNRTWPLGQS